VRYRYIPAVILDWAGTTVDFGSLAPVAALQRIFEANRVSITTAEAREHADSGRMRNRGRMEIRRAAHRFHHRLYTGTAGRGDSGGGAPRLRAGRQRNARRSGRGRPKPFMCYRNAILLGAYPLWRCVKIGDTASDIAEGINAGMWTVGITASGNEIGLSRGEWEALPPVTRATCERDASRRLTEAGARFTAASLANCTEILEEIERRLAAGERP
jgi:phosphonoacetaldehyde hydrolase